MWGLWGWGAVVRQEEVRRGSGGSVRRGKEPFRRVGSEDLSRVAIKPNHGRAQYEQLKFSDRFHEKHLSQRSLFNVLKTNRNQHRPSTLLLVTMIKMYFMSE